jgi:hypothetical protein
MAKVNSYCRVDGIVGRQDVIDDTQTETELRAKDEYTMDTQEHYLQMMLLLSLVTDHSEHVDCRV